jgi:glycopeptide antibiotics resistance protein
MFEKAVHDNWPMLTIFFITMVVIRFAYLKNNRGNKPFYQEFFDIIAVLYILLLFELLTNSEANVGGGLNLAPFSEITRYRFGSNLYNLNVIGNILIFIPFGLFVGNYVNPKKVSTPLLVTLVVSMSVEFIQLNIGRSFDVDDIILNVFGSMIGYFLYIGLCAIKKHLPKFLQKDGLYNALCIIIIVIIILYSLKLMGVLAVK